MTTVKDKSVIFQYFQEKLELSDSDIGHLHIIPYSEKGQECTLNIVIVTTRVN